jgi:hypothetical protein
VDVELEALVDEQLLMRIHEGSLLLPVKSGSFLSQLLYSGLCSLFVTWMAEIHVLLCMVIIHLRREWRPIHLPVYHITGNGGVP